MVNFIQPNDLWLNHFRLNNTDERVELHPSQALPTTGSGTLNRDGAGVLTWVNGTAYPFLTTDLGNVRPTTPEPYIYVDDTLGKPGVLLIWADSQGKFVPIDAISPEFTSKQAFSFTGADQTWTPPPTALWARFKCWGSGGLRSCGGYSEGVFLLADLDETTFTIVSGGQGVVSAGNPAGGYGFGGAGLGSGTGVPSSGGSGLSGVFRGGTAVAATDQARALVVAGGVGEPFSANAGTDGFVNGGTGNNTNTAGGEATMMGTNGDATTPQNGFITNGGGGGGYNGGSPRPFGTLGAASADGGSGFVHADAYSSVILFTPEDRTDHPNTGGFDVAVDDVSPNDSDPDKGSAGNKQNNGLVVVEWG